MANENRQSKAQRRQAVERQLEQQKQQRQRKQQNSQQTSKPARKRLEGEKRPVREPVEPHRKCKICHGEWHGVGIATGKYGKFTYYRCNECGFRWKVDFQDEVISYRKATVHEVKSRDL